MDTVTIHAAKTSLSQLPARVEAGGEIVVARGKRPVAKPVPPQPVATKRQLGALRDPITINPDCFAPLTEQELADWE